MKYLAATSAELIQEDPELELSAPPTINTVVFRYRPDQDGQAADGLNRAIRLELLRQGKAVIAQTRVNSSNAYFISPRATGNSRAIPVTGTLEV